MKFYKFILNPLQVIDFTNSTEKIINDQSIIFNSSSSCLIPNKHTEGGYLMNIRYVNYNINDSGNYLNCDTYIITHNKYCELNNNFEIINEKWIKTEFEDRRYIGVEDIRIFYENDDVLFIGTRYHKNNKLGIVYGKYDTTNYEFQQYEISPSFTNSDCEKNWVYINCKNKTQIIYKWSPLQICNIDKDKINIVDTKIMPKIFDRVRGSTCGFNYNFKLNAPSILSDSNIELKIEETEIWFVVHIVSYENPRHYYHMFVVCDASMNLLRYSAPFKFEDNPIEFCLSVVVESDRVLVNYSNWDKTTKIAVYDKTYIDTLIKYT